MAGGGLLMVLIGFAGDWYWLADLLAQLRPQYCLWLGLAWVGSLLLRQWPSLLVATIGLLLNAVALAPHARSWREPGAPLLAGRTWKLATINLLQGNRRTSGVLSYLRDTQPDIVVFQEVTARWATTLEPLSDLYPYRLVQPSKDQFGLALFSREKPIAQSVRAVGERVGDLAIFGTWESQGRNFSVVGIHPDKPDERWKTRNRATYLGRVAEWVEERAMNDEAVVVIGDYNATPWSASLRSFTRRTGLHNANQGRIFGATWNVWQPQRLLIDHALFSDHWTLLECTIGPAIGSDHRPLFVSLALKK